VVRQSTDDEAKAPAPPGNFEHAFMKTLLANIEFARPYFLWLLLALPLLWLRIRDRHLAIVLGRTAIVGLLILTLADPQSISEQAQSEERIFAYDVSQSIPAAMRQWMVQATKELAPSRQDRTFVFGASAKEASTVDTAGIGDRTMQTGVDGQKTNLENLLSTLLELPSAPRSLYLFSDGWETRGNVERLLPAAAAAGIKIYPMLPAERPAIPNVAVTKILTPTQGERGESLHLKVVLDNQNDHPVEGSLTLARNGQLFKTVVVKLAPGSQSFSYQTTPTEGLLTSFQASFSTRDKASDLYPADNHALAWVTIRSKAKMLLINGHSGAGRYLEEILKRQGFDLTVRTAESAPAPAGFKVIIFNNAEREKFPAGYLAAVERHVFDGNNFIMLGADNSFAPASYRQTPIEKLLPVEPKEPPKREEKNRAVVLVIDKSGSMRDDNRILYAKEAAKAVARQLKDIDLLGVVGFDDSPFVVVYLETMARLRGVVENQIDRLKPGGETYFLPALNEAKRQLERTDASRKHIILLSDGKTRGSDGALLDLAIMMRKELKITVSAIAIGYDADIRILKRISQYGGGLFHHTIDPSSLPQIVLEQLQDKPKDEPQDDGPLIPIAERGSELLAGLAIRSFPAVLGYMDTELKRGAQLDLALQRPERRAPLLASWRYGKGKSIALTTDLEARWSRNWIQWDGLQNFWARLFEWLSPSEENLVPTHEARVSLIANRSVLDLSIYDDSSANSQYRFSASGKAGKSEGALAKLAPGHYQATLPLTIPDDYRIDLTEDRGGRRIAFPPVGYTLSYDQTSELPRPEFNTQLLSRLAQATGGEINPQSKDKVTKTSLSKSYRQTRRPFLIAIFCLFLFEVAMRKFAFAEPD
jgi:uncharacterized membrane protein